MGKLTNFLWLFSMAISWITLSGSYISWLVVVSTPLKHINWDDYASYLDKTCSKPPNSKLFLTHFDLELKPLSRARQELGGMGLCVLRTIVGCFWTIVMQTPLCKWHPGNYLKAWLHEFLHVTKHKCITIYTYILIYIYIYIYAFILCMCKSMFYYVCVYTHP